MYDWNDLRAFLAVARGGSAMAASKTLGVNQTTVVRRLEALEQALGLKLVDRDQGGSRLTEAGQTILADAELVEAAAEKLARTVALHHRGAAGSVRVTCSEMIANLILAPALVEFRKIYPQITVELVITDAMLDLKAGEADVAIRGGFALADSDLIARKVSDDDFGLYCSRGYAEAHGVPATLDDLQDHVLIGGEGVMANMPGMAWMLRHAPDAEIACRSSTMTNLMASVRAGLGIGPVPCLVGDADPRLVRVHGAIDGARAATWVLTRPDLKDTPRVRAFIDFIVPHYAAVRRNMLARAAEMGSP
jgi:molybdate transport repressor ModE-like protein